MSNNLAQYFKILLLILLFSNSVVFTQITSTAQGGRWEVASTWVGGVAPSSNSDVVINGPVICSTGGGIACNNLTVNSSGTLYNGVGYAWPEQILIVNGNIINNGTIRNEGGNGFVIKVKGNITNNGTWTFKRVEFIGTSQTLSIAAGRKFESYFLVDPTIKPTLIAGSDINLTSAIELNKSRLDMKNFNVTFHGQGASIYNGEIINARDLVGRKDPTNSSYPILSNILYDGNLSMKGILRVDAGVTMKGTVTLTDTLENSTGYAHPEKKLTINGSFVNNGLIRNGGSAGFALNITGDVTNNGTWIHNRTELSGSSNQVLTLASGKIFDSPFKVTDQSGQIVAGSALFFTGGFDLNNSKFDLKNFSLTLRGSAANIYNGEIINAAELAGRKDPTNSTYPILSTILYDGNLNLKGILRVDAGVTMKGNVILTDTLENSTGYAHPEKKLTINGSFVNNGLVRNGGSAGFALNISGNLTNNGTWIHNRTELSGSSNQVLTLGSGKIFDSPFKVSDKSGQIVAGSALLFTSGFDLNTCSFDLKKYSITLRGSGANVYNGVVLNAIDLVGRKDPTNSTYPILSNILYDGSLNLKGILRIDWGVTMRGSVAVTDTVENSTGYAHPEKILKIVGQLTNNGVVRDGGSSGFVLDITGNIVLNKNLNNKRVQFSGDGKRTVNLTGYTGSIVSSGTNVMLSGLNYLPHLSVSSGTYCEISGDGVLYLADAVSGNLVNKGSIVKSKKIINTGDHSFYKTTVRLAAITALDSLTVEQYGYQVHSSFANALKAYWKLNPVPGNSTLTIDQLTLYYEDNQVGNNDESTLQVFHSSDGAQTWKQISTPISITRDPVNNWVRIDNAPISGDFVLSSSANPLTVIPSIVVSIIGRSQIRVGPPNRYTVYYVNNSDVPTDDFLLAINTGSRVHILKSEHPQADGTVEIIPADSLFYENEDTTLVFYVAGLAPREERTFDIIATADNVGLAKSNSAMFIDPASITVATVTVWAAKAAAVYVAVKTIDYVFKKAKENLELTPEEKKAWEADVNKIPEEIKTKETKKEWAAKKIGTKIIEKGMGLVGGSVDLVRAVSRGIWNLKDNLRRKIFAKIQSDLEVPKEETIDGTTYKTEVSGLNTKTTQRVTSWDPNEKIGPTGFGDKKFITTAGKMSYQILFENKKEATAPAYRILITDTLSSVYDPESVVFGKTSHEGDLYNWTISRNGNVLKWEIEGIELPPNVNPPEGEGYVLFTVNTKNNLPSGTEIKNKATIIFDINKPIVTNEYINKMDFVAPKTTMLPVKQIVNKDELLVLWNSDDGADGSGIESTTIFMSVDNGPFTFAGSSNNDSLFVKMISGTHTYSFYGLSKDNVGNVESTMPNVTDISGTSSVKPFDDTIPVKYSLEQNFPNPFNPTTTIGFSIPVSGNVSLKIYNVLGQEVVTLVNEELNAGNYKTVWYAKNISSGIYFYRLESGDFIQTKKLLLLK